MQTRKRGHTATGATCYRLGLAGESVFTGTDGAPRAFDFTNRKGIGTSGCSLPEGAGDEWRDPLTWARRIELVDYRSNSRQFRDDVVGIPHELVAEGKTEEAIAAYAQRIAERWRTPVHWVIHDIAGKNPHAHVLYAGRAVENDKFAKKRDREQDQRSNPKRGQKSVTELHSEFWIATLAERGHEASFEPTAEDGKSQDHIGPHIWALERKAFQHEIAQGLADALDQENPIDPGDAFQAAQAATAQLTPYDVLALDRDPVTVAAGEVRKPILDVPAPMELERPQRPAPAVEVPAPEPRFPEAAKLPQAQSRYLHPVELDPPQRPAPAVQLPAPEPRFPEAAVLPQAQSRYLHPVELDPPQRPAPAVQLPAPEPRHPEAAVLRQAQSRYLRPVELDPPQRPAPAVQLPAPEPRFPEAAVLKHPGSAPRTAGLSHPGSTPTRITLPRPDTRHPKPMRLPKPEKQKTPLQDADEWKAKAEEKRRTAARDRLDSAITAETVQAAGEDLIRSHAGDASAWPTFHGIGLKASAAAVDALRPHVKRHQVAERNTRRKAHTDSQYLDAVKRAIGKFREWWSGSWRKRPAAAQIVPELIERTWPVHWQETQEADREAWKRIEEQAAAKRRREQATSQQPYRPKLVSTTRRKRRPGSQGEDGGHDL